MARSRTCAVPECGRALYSGNRTGVCRQHNHASGFCRCTQCAPGQRPTCRVESRDELVPEGLVHEEPTKARRAPGMPIPPWEHDDV